jgi:hypothetical protein
MERKYDKLEGLYSNVRVHAVEICGLKNYIATPKFKIGKMIITSFTYRC